MGFTKGEQVAALFGDKFDLGDIIVTSVTVTTAFATASFTHGLTGTPDFVLFASSAGETATGALTIDGTTVTYTRAVTATAQTYYFLAGDLA